MVYWMQLSGMKQVGVRDIDEVINIDLTFIDDAQYSLNALGARVN
jgi:hypothetical protein